MRVCDAAGAIDFQRAPQRVDERFDLVLDLNDTPAFGMHQPPQGYFHATDDAALVTAVLKLRELTGELREAQVLQLPATAVRAQPQRADRLHRLHRGLLGAGDPQRRVAEGQVARPRGQGGAQGTAYIGGGIVVEPHLCVGCGACSTVCPSGAMSFAYPGTVDQGKRLRTLVHAYTQAGGRDAALLLHSEGAGAALVDALGRATRTDKTLHGVPARVLPVAVWHTASIGIDLWLSAIAQGASQVWVLLTDEEAPSYRQALAEQMAVAQAILTGLGYAGTHLRLVEARDAAALDAALRAAPAATVARRRHLRGAGRQARDAGPGHRPPAGRGARAGRRVAAARRRLRPSAACWSTPPSARCA